MGIETILSIGVSITIICGAIWALFQHLIKSELKERDEASGRMSTRMNETLSRLDKTLDKLSSIVDRLDDRQHRTEQELAIIKTSMDAMHERQDSMSDDIAKFAQFCYNTRACEGEDCSAAVVGVMQRSRRGG